MTNADRVKYYYDKGWASLMQVQMYHQYKVISNEEYYTITQDKLYLQSLVDAGTMTSEEYSSIVGEEYQVA